MPDAVTAYIGLGANLGEPAAMVVSAIAAIADMEGVALISQSSLYASAPVDAGGPDYVNAVVEIRTTRSAFDLLAQLQTLEQQGGRTRSYTNAPRTLDLDLLMHGDCSCQTEVLTLPHPRMWQRAFVLMPLQEIAPSLVTQTQLRMVQDQRVVRLL